MLILYINKNMREKFGIFVPKLYQPNNLGTVEQQDIFITNSDIGNNGFNKNRNNPMINDELSFSSLSNKPMHFYELEHNEDFNPEIEVLKAPIGSRPAEKKVKFSKKQIQQHQNDVFKFPKYVFHNTNNEGVDVIDKINLQYVSKGNEFNKNDKTIFEIYNDLVSRN